MYICVLALHGLEKLWLAPELIFIYLLFVCVGMSAESRSRGTQIKQKGLCAASHLLYFVLNTPTTVVASAVYVCNTMKSARARQIQAFRRPVICLFMLKNGIKYRRALPAAQTCRAALFASLKPVWRLLRLYFLRKPICAPALCRLCALNLLYTFASVNRVAGWAAAVSDVSKSTAPKRRSWKLFCSRLDSTFALVRIPIKRPSLMNLWIYFHPAESGGRLSKE